MRSLSEYRWDKVYRRLKLRLRNAEKVLEIVENYDVMERLKEKAWRDYWDEVPELRKPEAENWFGLSTKQRQGERRKR